ncbi:MAG: penicillin-binding protein 2 [Chloroflexota bacterium]
MTLFIFLRLLSYQIFGDVESLPDLPSRNPAARGIIVDRNGNLLAGDRFIYELRIAPDQVKSEEERAVLAHGLESFIGLDAAETILKLQLNAEKNYLMLAKDIPFSQGQMISQWVQETSDAYPFLQVLEIAPIPQRYYPQKELAAQTIGFVGLSSSRDAHYGLEEYYNTFLQADGVSLTDPRNSLSIDSLPQEVRRFIPSVAGHDLVLTLDRGIQWIIEDELKLGVELYQAVGGTIIVMDPHTGAIRGLANWPAYDPNAYPTVKDLSLFTNPAISAQYEPGSIFKVITMAAAIDSEIVAPYTRFVDSGSITVGERIIFNSTRTAYGDVTAAEALALSINVVTAEIAERLGPDRLYEYIRSFGFGRATKVDLAGEIPGLLKTPSSPEWSYSDVATNSFGQGIAVTPIQMICSVAAIANQGKLLRPYIVQSRIQDGQVQETEPTVVHQVISPKSTSQLTEMMVGVVETNVQSAIPQGYRVAGKTGTAQIPGEGGYLDDQIIASFVGFGPVEAPEFVILIKLDRPNMLISQWATTSAAPIFGRVAGRLFEYAGIPPR